MVFARDARSKTRIWMDMLILDPSRVYIKRKSTENFHSQAVKNNTGFGQQRPKSKVRISQRCLKFYSN